jgi:hypothetical protein
MKRLIWEYRVLKVTAVSQFAENLGHSLNLQGSQGWELVLITELRVGHPIIIFKRPTELR